MTTPLSIYLWVALGGAIGAPLRFYLTQIAVSLFGKQFPFGTLAVNVIGSFSIALIYGLIEKGSVADSPYRYLIGVGLLGALTTFSTFSFETLSLMNNGLWFKAMTNVVLNVTVCLFATFLGVQIIKG
jgi:CrcB protein